MGPRYDLKKIIFLLDRLHSENSPWNDEYEFTDFITTRNGLERHFTRDAKKHLRELARALHIQRALLHKSGSASVERVALVA
ncbi:hypothetical protein, partial [Massilia timonae]|uniref:hypothetical protein n=1 Tax=Massilia timonae TaxID=47229 RepID=UPI003F8A8397